MITSSAGGAQEGRRWFAGAYYTRQPSISVIEAPAAVEEERKKRKGERVPFGFARAIPRTPTESLLWEGDDG